MRRLKFDPRMVHHNMLKLRCSLRYGLAWYLALTGASGNACDAAATGVACIAILVLQKSWCVFWVVLIALKRP